MLITKLIIKEQQFSILQVFCLNLVSFKISKRIHSLTYYPGHKVIIVDIFNLFLTTFLKFVIKEHIYKKTSVSATMYFEHANKHKKCSCHWSLSKYLQILQSDTVYATYIYNRHFLQKDSYFLTPILNSRRW